MALNVSLDWNNLLRIAFVATERTSAFLALGLRTADQAPPTSLALGKASSLRILPEPLPLELARDILGDWRIWVVGAALRELDGR